MTLLERAKKIKALHRKATLQSNELHEDQCSAAIKSLEKIYPTVKFKFNKSTCGGFDIVGNCTNTSIEVIAEVYTSVELDLDLHLKGKIEKIKKDCMKLLGIECKKESKKCTSNTPCADCTRIRANENIFRHYIVLDDSAKQLALNTISKLMIEYQYVKHTNVSVVIV